VVGGRCGAPFNSFFFTAVKVCVYFDFSSHLTEPFNNITPALPTPWKYLINGQGISKTALRERPSV